MNLGTDLNAAAHDAVTDEATSPPPCAQDTPSPHINFTGRRCSRRLAARRPVYYADHSDSEMDIDSNSQHSDNPSLTASVEGGKEEISDEDKGPTRKCRKSSIPSSRKTYSTSARVERCRRVGLPSTSTRRSVEDQELPLTGIANSVPPQVARHHILEAILAKCGQFPLGSASLDCTIGNGKPMF